METTAPYSPAQNGIAKRLNWTLLEHAWVMIFTKNLLKTLWPEAITYACYIKNRSLTWEFGSDIMPFQALFAKKPDIACLEEFRTTCWVMVPDQHQAKLDPKVEEHLFVGIAEYTKAWKYYNKISKHVQISRNITFDQSDTKLYPILDVNTNDKDTAPLEGEQEPHEHVPISISSLSIMSSPVPESPAPQIQWIDWVTQRPDYWKLNNGEHAYITWEIITELENYQAAVSHYNAPIWEEVMKMEMVQHQELRTWEITELPPGWMAIGCQ